MSDEEMACAIAAMRWAMNDTLKAAASVAARGSDQFSGTEACVLFSAARDVILNLDNHPAMRALAAASLRRRMRPRGSGDE